MSERELTEPVDLCDGRGRLNPAARGWSRSPLHRCNLAGAHGRKKRWDYWAVLAPDLHLSITYADVDYLGLASVWLHRPSSGLVVEVGRSIPFAPGFRLPELPGSGRMAVASFGFCLSIDDQADATWLRVSCGTEHGPLDVSIRVDRPERHDSLNVVIPWSERRFQFTTKDNTRVATGVVRLGDDELQLGPDDGAYGVLDAGRGVWKYANRWNWASASGRGAAGELVGLQFGGKWTEGTGHTENGVCVDGRLHKIGDELVWEYDWDHPMRPWRVTDPVGGRVDATLTPTFDRHSRVSVGVLSMEVHQCFGTWSGTVVGEDGAVVDFRDIAGFAEEARNRW